MTYTPINHGTAANDGTGDTLHEAAVKINANFAALNTSIAALDMTTKPGKTTPVDTDTLCIVDSGQLKQLSFADLITYLNTRYVAIPPTPSSSVYDLLLHFDSFPFVDSGKDNLAITSQIITLDTTNKVFGAGSAIGGGAGGVIGVPAPFSLGVGDLTIRFRLTHTNNPAYTVILTPTTGKALSIVVTDTGLLYVAISYDGSTQSAHTYSNITFQLGATCAVSVEIFNSRLYLYQDGLLKGSIILTSPLYDNISGISIAGIAGTPLTSLIGNIDEFMILKGTALAAGAASYTVEAVAFS